MREPVRKHERGARRVEVAICEDEDLKALVECLDRVWGAGREATFGKEYQALSMDARCRGRDSLVNVWVCTLQRALDVGRVAPCAVVDSGDATGAIEDVSPLSHAVPVTVAQRSGSVHALYGDTGRRPCLQLTVRVGREANLGGSQVLCGRS